MSTWTETTTAAADIRRALQYAADKFAKDAGFPIPTPVAIPISESRWDQARANGWIDENGNFTDKASDASVEFIRVCCEELREAQNAPQK